MAWLDEHGAFKIEGRMYERLKKLRPREALSVFGGAI